MESILQVKENYKEDDSIKSLETYAYQPISGTQLNEAGQITIRIENQDAFFYPRRSWLQFEGKLVEVNGDAYVSGKLISLVNNGLMNLFDNIKYELSGQEIESIYHPGQLTTMFGASRYSTCFNAGAGLNQCWSMDTSKGEAATSNLGFKARQDYIIEQSIPLGTFRFAIDLEHIFGFCEDYNKVMYGFTHALTLIRGASSDNAVFRATGVAAATVVLEKISWMMPKVEPSDEKRYQLYKSIEQRETLAVRGLTGG